jgi:uncharacterized membrane protein
MCMAFLFSKLGLVVIVGFTAIGVLVGLVWRQWAPHRRARIRPASPEAMDEQRRRTLRQIAASDYRPKRHEKDGHAR